MTHPVPVYSFERTAGLGVWIKALALRLGFDAAGIARVEPSEHARLYLSWLAEGRHGDMAYLERDDAIQRRLRPDLAHPGLRSAVVVTMHYPAGSPIGVPGETATPRQSGAARDAVHEAPANQRDRGIIARYARGRDYHIVMKTRLMRLLRAIEDEVGHQLPLARASVDTAPVLERELANRAGIGWHAKNTMLIDPRRGSYFFIGTLLLELDLEPDEPFTADRCGTCHACLDACPTGALLGRDENGAPVMDARLCISYLTIENRGPIPVELRPKIGNRVFGCDICQEVCPWNARFAEDAEPDAAFAGRGPGERPHGVQPGAGRSRQAIETRPTPATDAPPLVDLMRMTRDEWDVWTRGSAIRRAGYAGFKRNVAVAMGNWLAAADQPPEEAVAALTSALLDPEPLVRGHAAWALGEVRSPQALHALESSLPSEADPFVRSQLEAALLIARPRGE